MYLSSWKRSSCRRLQRLPWRKLLHGCSRAPLAPRRALTCRACPTEFNTVCLFHRVFTTQRTRECRGRFKGVGEVAHERVELNESARVVGGYEGPPQNSTQQTNLLYALAIAIRIFLPFLLIEKGLSTSMLLWKYYPDLRYTSAYLRASDDECHGDLSGTVRNLALQV